MPLVQREDEAQRQGERRYPEVGQIARSGCALPQRAFERLLPANFGDDVCLRFDAAQRVERWLPVAQEHQ